MTVESLKKEARRHEQREEWVKALGLYLQAIERQQEEDEPDIALHNRVGDLQVRLGDLEGAIENYERAIRLYVDAELPNNAIAICRKIIRHDPERPTPYLRMGQIRARQGFAVDARENFVTYAEMLQARGETDEALRALEEFVGLAPEDIDTRVFLAEQLVARDRSSEAVVYLSEARRIALSSGQSDQAETILDRIREIQPDFEPEDDLGVVEASAVEEPSSVESMAEEAWPAGPSLEAFEPATELPPETSELELVEPTDEPPSPEESGWDTEGLEITGFEVGELETSEGDGTAGEVDAEEGLIEEEELWDRTAEEGPAVETAGIGGALTEEEEVGNDEATSLEGAVSLEEAAPLAPPEPEEPLLTGEFNLDDLDDLQEVEGEDEFAASLDLDLESSDFDLDLGEEKLEGAANVDLGEEKSEGVANIDLGEGTPDVDLGEEKLEGAANVDLGEGAPEDEGPDIDLDLEEVDLELPETEEGSDSVAALRARVERAPDDANAWEALGEALLTLGWDTEGRDALDRAHRLYAERDEPAEAMRVLRALLAQDPHRLELRQRMVEYAHETADRDLLLEAFLELAEGLGAEGEDLKAAAVFEQVLTLEPENRRALEALGREPAMPVPSAEGVASDSDRSPPHGSSGGGSEEGYVDLGAMVLEPEGETSTRFVVPTEEPSGDEEADFARMLSQFKEKVAENISRDDARSHYDLGSAYKEMGLLREAIGEFQQALRAQPNNLATFEMLGQCFLEMGDPEVAIRTLERGLKLPIEVEDDLLGVYYGLAQAHEEVGETEAAREFYERIFSLDINFKDVVERLNALR